MIVPTIDISGLPAKVAALEKELAPDVVRIRYDLGEDWSGDPAVFFRVLLRDEASTRDRLRELSPLLLSRLTKLVDFPASGVLAYFDVRSVSTQARLREAAWE